MCGIVGLFLKNDTLRQDLGRLTAAMLHEMRDRGPDSAGFAIYDDSSGEQTRLTLLAEGQEFDWGPLAAELEAAFAIDVSVRRELDHAVFITSGKGREVRQYIIDNVSDTSVLSYGSHIELYKSVGDPDLVASRYDLASRSGTHAIAHTRMATESAVTTNGSHPFSTGANTCIVHNGSLSNHNQLRRRLRGQILRLEAERLLRARADRIPGRIQRVKLLRSREAGNGCGSL
jgi:glutamate synthase domain-containing protein 1